jgi:chromate transporter
MKFRTASVSRLDIFKAFLAIGAVSFGGAQPWARRKLVEQKGWITSDEFAELLGLGQVLPGPNVVNLSIMVGRRFQGALGAFLAVSGLLLVPVVVVFGLAAIYAQFGSLPVVRQAFNGVAVGTAGLIAAMAVKMLQKHQRSWQSWFLVALAFATAGLLAWPLWIVLLALTPIGACLVRWGKL